MISWANSGPSAEEIHLDLNRSDSIPTNARSSLKKPILFLVA
ncbi:conserved hypothetical protein [delta proteobacterium NaphS2]|nr:conserved hypothetical protein [delta proteobacterium NaphS2]